MFKKIRNRVENQGFFSALNYFFFTVLLEKLGLEIILRFSRKLTGIETLPEYISLFHSEDEMPENILNGLVEACGERFTRTLNKKFSNRGVLAVGIVNNQAASIAWLGRFESSKCQSQSWLINGCLTMPKYRGLGLYPKSIEALCHKAYTMRQSPLPVEVLIESSFSNEASIKGIIKSGFTRRGGVVLFRDKEIFNMTKRH